MSFNDLSQKLSLREFIVDVLGSLVPGIAFLFSIFPALVIPAIAVTNYIIPENNLSFPNFQNSIPTEIGTILFLLFPTLLGFFVFAYIIGHLFYRQDPKKADEASFNRIPRTDHNDGMVRKVMDGRCPVEFPYHFLKQYLVDRGITYLAAHVPWDGSEKSDGWRRAKHFANALKIRINIAAPNSYAVLAKNEAHTRLSSSMWYVSKMLIYCSFCGLMILTIGILLARSLIHQNAAPFSAIFILPIVTLITSWYAKFAIEKALHYQREREILFILETAHWLMISEKVPNIFTGLEPYSKQTSNSR